ncbi:MAG: C40 family peptidase [Clostridia bacterium]|nr:C40 family peptidase [Clostridia bacterium]
MRQNNEEKGRSVLNRSVGTAERTRGGYLRDATGISDSEYYANVGRYGIKGANDKLQEQLNKTGEIVRRNRDPDYRAEQQHIHRISNAGGNEWEEYKAERWSKTASDEEKSQYIIDTYHLRNDKEALNEYYRTLNEKGIEEAAQFAFGRSGYKKPEEYINSGITGIRSDRDFQWELEKRDMSLRDRRYYDKQDRIYQKYFDMMKADPEAESKINAGMNHVNRELSKEQTEDARAIISGGERGKVHYEHVTDEEKRIWAYISQISKDDEKTFLDSMEYKLRERDREDSEKLIAEIAREYPILAGAGDVFGTAFVRPATAAEALVNTVGQTVKEANGGEYIPSRALANKNTGEINLNALNAAVLDNIDNETLKFAYSTGSSILQNAVGAVIFQNFYPAVMATTAAGSSTHEGLERGLDKRLALLEGSIDGGIEYFTEKLGYDRLSGILSNPLSKVSQSRIKDIGVAFFKYGLPEGLEELTSYYLQDVTDRIIAGDLSTFNLTIKKYMNEDGLSHDDAYKAAVFDCYVKEPLISAASGYISGGFMGAGASQISTLRYGRSLIENNIGDGMLTKALKQDKSSETYKAAEKILNGLKSGERVSTYDYGKLYSAMAQEKVTLSEKEVEKSLKGPKYIYKKKGGGVAGTVAAGRISGVKYKFLDTLGKARGINFVISDYIGKETPDEYVIDAANGLVSSKDPNTIFLSANSERPILGVAKHELVHLFSKTKAGQAYIRNITENMKKADSEAFEAEVQKKIKTYAEYGESISRAKAEEEVAADAAYKMLGKFSEVLKLAKEHPRLAEKIYAKLVDLVGTIDGSYKAAGNIAEGIVDKMTEQELSESKQMFAAVLGETARPAMGESYSMKNEEGVSDGTEYSYSLKEPPLSINDMTDSEIEELELQSRGKAYGSKQGARGLSDAEVRRSKLAEQEDIDTDYLRRENNTLRIMLDRLSRSVRNVTEGRLQMDSKTLVNAINGIIKENGSMVKSKTVAPLVAQAYSYIQEIATNGKLSEADRNKLGDRADKLLTKAAKRIVDGYQTYDYTAFNETKEMRNFIRGTTIKIPDGFDQASDFRKTNQGRIRLSNKKGTAVDTFYRELSELYPDFFNDSVIINQEDQLRHIASVLDSLRPTPTGLSTAEYEDAVKDVAVQLSAKFVDVVYDTKARIDIISQIEAETREKFRSFYENSVKKERERFAEKRKRLDSFYREKNEAIKEKARERKERSETLDKLQALLKRVRNLKTTDPEARGHLNAALAEVAYLYSGAKGRPRVMSEETLRDIFGDDYKNVLENMSEDEKLEHAMKELEGGKQFISIDAIRRYYYDVAVKDPNHVRNNFLERKFEAAQLTGINELTVEDAREIIEMLTAIETEVQNANKLLDSKVKTSVSVAAHETINQLKKVKGSKGKGTISNFITGHLTPISALRKFVGYLKDSKFVKLAQEVSDGERTKDKVIQRSMELFDDFISKKENKKFLESLDDVIEIADGVKITKGMKLSLCLYARNKASAEHIHGGGITIPDIDLLKKGDKSAAYKKGRTVQLTQEMQMRLASSLTEQEKALLDNIDKVMNYIANGINKVSLELYGVETATVKNYFPILTDKAFIGKDVDAFEQVGGVENAGFMKERRPGAYTPIVLDNCLSVTMSHINAAAKVIGLSIPMRNFKMVYNSVSYAPVFDFEGGVRDTSYDSLKKGLEKAWGNEAVNYIDNFINDIERGRREDRDYSKFLDKRFSALARSALLVNLSVVMKQAAAYPIAAAELGGMPLIKGAFHHVTAEDRALYDSLTPVIWKRKQGYGMADFSDYANGASLEQRLPALFGWIQKSDVWTAYRICKACEMYVNSNFDYQKGSKEWNEKLAETINRTIERTQQGSNISQKAAVLRSPNSLVHALNMFKTQTYLQFDLIYDAIGEFNAYKKYVKDGSVTKEDMSKSSRKVANVLSAYLASEVVMNVATAIWRSFAYDKKEWEDEDGKFSVEKLLKFFGKNFAMDSLGMLMYGNEISDVIFSILSDEKYYGIDVSPLALISDAADSFVKVAGKYKNILDAGKEGKYYTWKDLIKPTADFAEDFAALFGFPAGPMKRLAGGIYRNAFDILAKTPLAEESEDVRRAIESVFEAPADYFGKDKKAASENYKNLKNFDNADDYKKYSKASGVIDDFKKYIVNDPSCREDVEKYMIQYADFVSNYELPSDVKAEAERLYKALMDAGHQDVAEKAVPYTTATSEISFKYGGETFKHLLNYKDYNNYVRGLYKVNEDAYRELMQDETYKAQDPITQLKMLDKLRTEKTRVYEAEKFDELVGFTAEQREAEERALYNNAANFKGLPGKDYIKIQGYQFEVTPQTKKKYDDFIDWFDGFVKKALESGASLNDIPGFEKVYFKDDNGKKIYINHPYNQYNKTYQKKIDEKIKAVAKKSFENPVTDEQEKLLREIMYGTGYVYAKDDNIMQNVANGDYTKNAWQRRNVADISAAAKAQVEAEQKKQKKSGGAKAVEIAQQYKGVDYKWGGTTPSGFDCSGLMWYVYDQLGIKIDRQARAQFKNNGTPVNKDELQPGDLVFFTGYTNDPDKPGHVGMYIGNGEFIHAPSSGDVVKVSKLSGRKDYVGARRIINE